MPEFSSWISKLKIQGLVTYVVADNPIFFPPFLITVFLALECFELSGMKLNYIQICEAAEIKFAPKR